MNQSWRGCQGSLIGLNPPPPLHAPDFSTNKGGLEGLFSEQHEKATREREQGYSNGGCIH